jgi:hypothetical protein
MTRTCDLRFREPPLGTRDAFFLQTALRRISGHDASRIGDVKLRGFQSTYIRRVRLIEKRGDFAEHGTGLRDPGNLDAFLYDCDRALLKDQ